MEFQKCLLCGERDATKTNSHLIPSFLVAQVCSYDGSGNRDKEVMFTMTPYEEKVYTGQILDTKYEELFDMEALSDERIERELKDNTASKDYIFCPVCEKRLSDILETPYAKYHKQGSKVEPEIAFMFWLSIIWRMSVSEQFAFRIPNDVENVIQLHMSNEYLPYPQLLPQQSFDVSYIDFGGQPHQTIVITWEDDFSMDRTVEMVVDM